MNRPDVRELIHWGKTLCLPHRTDVEWHVWQMALALERFALEPLAAPIKPVPLSQEKADVEATSREG